LRGWFLVPGDFAEQAPRDQPAYFRRHIRVQADVEHDADEDLTAMSWGAMAALLGRGHTLGCHSWSHRPLGEPIAPDTIRDEIERAREKLESRLGRRVRTFAWPRGRVDDYSIGALEAIRQTYDLAFSSMSRSIRPGDDPHLLDRFNVEASYPLEVVRFQISRINEAAFTRRRRQVRRHLGLPTSFGR
jgi:peptidoglycan/xylan/chitin deacetylase (PgdA/CDA1 family)